ncbi:MAG: Gfo/Idh/MocA family oxidoreductase [Alphaproteobacteria bacterium]|nr:Gfo/Idh/MocA family oxidoreductase [Alphaproteobacteria bacterium]
MAEPDLDPETSSTKRHGIAVIGAGMIGAAHASGYRAHIGRFGKELELHLATVCDTREEAAKSLASTYGFRNWVTDWRTVMADERVRIVSIALPNAAHVEVASAAIEAGKHMLCEKPLALSAAAARGLLDAAKRSGVIAGTVFNYRRFPAIAEIGKLVRAGEIGDPVHLLVQYQSEYGADPNLPHSWRDVRALAGGGALTDLGTHAIDIARFLCGEVAEVRGAAEAIVIKSRFCPAAATSGHDHATLSNERRPVDTDDVTSAILLFENGCQGLLSASRVAVGMGNTLSLVLCGTRGTVRHTTAVAGEYQIARLGGAGGGFSIVPNRPASPFVRDYLPVPHDGVAVGYAEAFGFMIAEFLAAIAAGVPFTNGSLTDGMKAAEVLEAIQRSAASHRPVVLRESGAGR